MQEIFKKKFEFASRYFDTLLSDCTKTPQSIVLEGLDIYGQYFFALEIARRLNCREDGRKDCNCLNCQWIRQGEHPHVNIVSPLDFKPSGDESKTVISIKQAREIVKTLNSACDYHRVFIFLNVAEGKRDFNAEKTLSQYKDIGFMLPQENKIFSGLTRKVFDDEAPNALLKSIEEPPSKTTFIFLTQNREDLINTITSRSFVFKLCTEKFSFDYQDIKNLFEKYPNLTFSDSLYISEKLLKYADENEILPTDILNMTEELFGEFYRANPNNSKIKKDLLKIQEAKRMLDISMKPKNVFDYLFLEMTL